MLEDVAEYIELTLNAVLLIRLFTLRLGRVYSTFSAFLICDLVLSIVAGLRGFGLVPVDYRILYSSARVVAWILSVWMVYALLSEILKSLPGILKYLERLLHVVFVVAFLAGVVLISTDNAAAMVEGSTSILNRMVVVTYAVDQALGVTVLLVLLVMLGFFLWFPVVVPRNLAIFSIGYVVYFSSTTATLVLQSFQTSGSSQVASTVLMLTTGVCYAYWAIFLSRAGESVPVRIGHHWKTDEQQRLMHRLEEVNGVLLQTLAGKKAA